MQFTRSVGHQQDDQPPVSLTGTAHSQNPDSDVEQYSEPTTLLNPWMKRERYLSGNLLDQSRFWVRKLVRNRLIGRRSDLPGDNQNEIFYRVETGA